LSTLPNKHPKSKKIRQIKYLIFVSECGRHNDVDEIFVGQPRSFSDVVHVVIGSGPAGGSAR